MVAKEFQGMVMMPKLPHPKDALCWLVDYYDGIRMINLKLSILPLEKTGRTKLFLSTGIFGPSLKEGSLPTITAAMLVSGRVHL